MRITEDWEAYNYDEDANKMNGLLYIAFGQNMSHYMKDNKFIMKKAGLDTMKEDIFKYFKNEYPTLKAKLSSANLDKNIHFEDIEKGLATLKYEINEAF